MCFVKLPSVPLLFDMRYASPLPAWNMIIRVECVSATEMAAAFAAAPVHQSLVLALPEMGFEGSGQFYYDRLSAPRDLTYG